TVFSRWRAALGCSVDEIRSGRACAKPPDRLRNHVEKKLRVLVAEDSEGEAASALRAIYAEEAGRLDLTTIGSFSTLLPTIAMVNPDVMMLDLRLVKHDRVEEVRGIHRAAPEVQIIVLGDSAEQEEAARCLEAGAINYLLKGFMDPRTVERALR